MLRVLTIAKTTTQYPWILQPSPVFLRDHCTSLEPSVTFNAYLHGVEDVDRYYRRRFLHAKCFPNRHLYVYLTAVSFYTCLKLLYHVNFITSCNEGTMEDQPRFNQLSRLGWCCSNPAKSVLVRHAAPAVQTGCSSFLVLAQLPPM